MKWTDERISKEAKALLVWFRESENHIYLVEFAAVQGYPKENFSRWAKAHSEFSQALKTAKTIQETRLAKMLYSRELYTPGIIFALKNVAGWRDVVETKQTVKQEVTYKDLTPKQRADRLGKLTDRLCFANTSIFDNLI